MAKSSAFLQLMALVFICMLKNAPRGGALITCSDITADLLPCLSYVTGGGKVPSGCCSGVKTLLSAGKTKTDLQTTCTCLKSIAADASNDELRRAKNTPKQCGVKIPFTISPNADCSKVNW